MQLGQTNQVIELGLPELTGTLLALCEAPLGSDGVPMVTPRVGRPLVSYGGLVNRLWEVFFSVVEFLRGESGYRRKVLVSSLTKSAESFRQVVDDLVDAHQKYQDYLEDSEGRRPVVEAEVAHARARICEWNNHIQTPEGMSLKDTIKKANSAFSILMADAKKHGIPLAGAYGSLVDYQAVFDALCRDQLLIDFEHRLHTPIPFTVMRKLCQPQYELSDVEKDTLRQWIEKVNDCWKLNARCLHRGLMALVDQLGYRDLPPTTLPSPLHLLEHHLVANGLKAIAQPDYVHIRWRQRAVDLGVVSVDGVTHDLDDKMGDGPSGRLDNRFVFTLQKDKRHVLVIAANEAALGLAAAEANTAADPIPLASVRGIYGGGRYALVERLVKPVKDYAWDCASEEKDKVALESLSGMLKTLARMEKTPVITADQLMFDSDDCVKMTHKAMPGERFDFDRIVDLAFECSNGNLKVFSHLLVESGLHKHRVVKYYNDVMRDTFAEKPIGEDKVAAKQKPSISDTFVRKRARHLGKEALAMRERSYYELMAQYVPPEDMKSKKIKEKIGKRILHLYTKSVGAGVLWPLLVSDVVKGVAKELNMKPRAKSK